MLETHFSTARTVITSWSAMPWLELPAANGTYLGATYANLFPNKVRALALDANSDPPAYTTGPRLSVPFVRIDAHIAASETLEQFFILCARAGAQCALADGGNPEQKFATLARRLKAMPLSLPDGQRVGYAELVDFTLQTLYRAADWATGAATLQQLYVITNATAGSPCGLCAQFTHRNVRHVTGWSRWALIP